MKIVPRPRSCLRNGEVARDRKSTRLNSSHSQISYAVFCLKKKKTTLPGGVAATTPSGRHFLGRVLLDEAGANDPVRRRIHVREPIQSPWVSEVRPTDAPRA